MKAAGAYFRPIMFHKRRNYTRALEDLQTARRKQAEALSAVAEHLRQHIHEGHPLSMEPTERLRAAGKSVNAAMDREVEEFKRYVYTREYSLLNLSTDK